MKNNIESKLVPYNENDSLFITFEGIEGSGKSTQIQYLKKYIESMGLSVLLLREPGGTHFGENLRNAILESKENISALSEAFLFASSRSQLLNQKILPFLRQSKTAVIVDRYIDSSIAYQGFARELGMQTILDIHSFGELKTLPNLTFYLKIDLETSMKRQKARGNEKDYFEKENNSFYSKLIDGYDSCAELFNKRVTTINAKQSVEAVSLEIQSVAKSYLGKK